MFKTQCVRAGAVHARRGRHAGDEEECRDVCTFGNGLADSNPDYHVVVIAMLEILPPHAKTQFHGDSEIRQSFESSWLIELKLPVCVPAQRA